MSAVQPVQPEDMSLVACILAGDEAAEDRFARQFFERFVYLARRAGVPAQDCQDVAQEAMLTALDQMRRGVFRGDGQFGHWLARIVRGKAMDYWRKQQLPRGASVVALDETGEVHNAVEAIASPMSDYELTACVHETLKTLPAQHHVILLMKRTYGYKIEEISRMLEMTMGQVSSRLYAAEEMFRRGMRGGKPPSERTPSRALAPGENYHRGMRREQANHHSSASPFVELRRAGDQPIDYSLLLRTHRRIGATIGRGTFAGMRRLLA